MTSTSSSPSSDPKLRHVLRDDLGRGDFFRTIREDYQEAKELFLDEHRKEMLSRMKPLKSKLKTIWWLLKALVLKLTPARRLLLVLAFILMIVDTRYQTGNVSIGGDVFLGFAVLLFILLLELKDKLLAKNELQAGRAVQEQLMPEASPAVPGWSLWLFTRTANDVGGDLVDFQRIAEDRYGVILADVAGKGLNAALLSVRLQATLRALVPEHTSLSELASHMNSFFRGDDIRRMFASFVYLELSPPDGRIRFVNAGHIPPQLVRNGSVTELEKGDPAIGLMKDTVYKEHEVAVDPGAWVILYSDGVTDAKNERNEFFGQDRLRSLLQRVSGEDAGEIGAHILREVEQFVGRARLYDDLSVVILRKK